MQRLVDHYDTLAGNALIRAGASKNEQERQECWRQWCFYSARAEELDDPSRREEIRRVEREFYRQYPPKEAKILTTTIVKIRPFAMIAKTLVAFAWIAGAGVYAYFAITENPGGIRTIEPTFWWFPGMLMFLGIGTLREGLSKKKNARTQRIHECGNCGGQLTSARMYSCPSCRVRLTQ